MLKTDFRLQFILFCCIYVILLFVILLKYLKLNLYKGFQLAYNFLF